MDIKEPAFPLRNQQRQRPSHGRAWVFEEHGRPGAQEQASGQSGAGGACGSCQGTADLEGSVQKRAMVGAEKHGAAVVRKDWWEAGEAGEPSR